MNSGGEKTSAVVYLPVSLSNPVSLCVGLPGSLGVSLYVYHMHPCSDSAGHGFTSSAEKILGLLLSGHCQVPGGKVKKGVFLKTNVALCLPSPSPVSHPSMKPLRQKRGLGWNLKQSITNPVTPLMTSPLPVEPSRRRTHSVHLGAQTWGLRLSFLLSERFSSIFILQIQNQADEVRAAQECSREKHFIMRPLGEGTDTGQPFLSSFYLR